MTGKSEDVLRGARTPSWLAQYSKTFPRYDFLGLHKRLLKAWGTIADSIDSPEVWYDLVLALARYPLNSPRLFRAFALPIEKDKFLSPSLFPYLDFLGSYRVAMREDPLDRLEFMLQAIEKADWYLGSVRRVRSELSEAWSSYLIGFLVFD